MVITFDNNDVFVDGGTFRISAFLDDRPITCLAPLEVIADADQAALESGILLKDKYATARFLRPFFANRIAGDRYDDSDRSTVTLRGEDIR